MTHQDRPNQARPRRLRRPERRVQAQFEPSYQARHSLAEVYGRLVPLRRRTLAEGEWSQQRCYESGQEAGQELARPRQRERSQRCS
jgi:hypothetical protein